MQTVMLYKPKKRYVLRGLWRYFITGRPLWGKGDNATFLRDATVDYRGGPVERLSRARWRRVARRWAGWIVPGGLLAWDWRAAALYGLLAAAGALTWAGHALAVWWPQRAVRRAYIYPAGRVLAQVTGKRFRRREALASIELTDETHARIYVPDVALDAGAQKRIVDAVGPRLGLPNATAAWTVAGVERAYVDLTPMALPPAAVALADIMDDLLSAPLAEPVVGLANGRTVIHMDFRNDSPHTLGSAGSGAGKSTLYKFVAMQRLRHPNTYAIILDFKKWSHLRWAGKLRGRVVIEDEVAPIHDLLCKVLDELLWRKSFDLHQEAELEALATIDVYVEEINTLMSLLAAYWKAEVARRKSDARAAVRLAKATEDEVALEDAEAELAAANGLSAISPAIQAIRYGVNLGREFKIHWHFIGQSMSAQAAGGRDTRESFRTRLLARWDRKTWKMLADGIDFIACPSAAVGVWAHVHGSEVEIVRVPYVRDEDAVAYVLGGAEPSMPMFHTDPRPSLVDASTRPAISDGATLRDLVDLLPSLPSGDRMSLDALRKAAQRPGFPAPIGELTAGRAAEYLLEDVMAWFKATRERVA